MNGVLMILNRTPLYLRDDDFVVLLGMYFHDFLDENSKESCQMTQIDSILEILVSTAQRRGYRRGMGEKEGDRPICI